MAVSSLLFRQANRIRLLKSGDAYFPALLQAISGAGSEICLESYIFADDDIGQRVVSALLEAVERGVMVRVLVDGFGAHDFAEGQAGQALQAAGAEVLVFRPKVVFYRLRRSRLRRMHRKLVVVDSRLAFLGGINIIDETTPPRLDYAVEIEGPVLFDIYKASRRLWRTVRLTHITRMPPASRAPVLNEACGDIEAAFVIRNNVLHRNDIENAYLEAINHAQKEIWIACAYFLPGRRFRQALYAAARRGVMVRLLLQGKMEYRLQYYATRALYGAFIRAGVRCFEYERSFLHAKVAVVDSRWVTIGSSNIDPFSLVLASEANVLINNENFAQELRHDLQDEMEQGAVEIGAGYRKSLAIRITSWLAYAVVRLLMSLSGVHTR